MQVDRAYDAAAEASCHGRLFKLSIAWREYYDASRRFPPTLGRDARGVEVDCNHLLTFTRDSYDPADYSCPHAGVHHWLVTGSGTIIDDGSELRLVDVTDGVENTLVAIEAIELQPDNEPFRLEIDDLPRLLDRAGQLAPDTIHRAGRGLLFADGSAFRQVKPMSKATVQALMTAAGHEDVTRDQLIADGTLKELFLKELELR